MVLSITEIEATPHTSTMTLKRIKDRECMLGPSSISWFGHQSNDSNRLIENHQDRNVCLVDTPTPKHTHPPTTSEEQRSLLFLFLLFWISFTLPIPSPSLFSFLVFLVFLVFFLLPILFDGRAARPTNCIGSNLILTQSSVKTSSTVNKARSTISSSTNNNWS